VQDTIHRLGDSAGPLFQVGVILLLVTVPMGVLFGVLTTRGVVRRLTPAGRCHGAPLPMETLVR
jgi:hypothetical protein